MSIYNPSNYDGEGVTLPYLQKNYTSKNLLNTTLAPVNSELDDHENRITVLETDSGPSYLPLIPKLTSTLNFFGDSNTAGYGVSATQRFSYLVCQSLGKTESNLGVSGDTTQDMAKRIYNGHTSGRSAVIAIGLNDLMKTPNNIVLDENIRAMEASIVWCALPFLKGVVTGTGWNLTDTRNTNYVTRSGTWGNVSEYNCGLVSNTIGSWLQATVTEDTSFLTWLHLRALQ